MDTQLHLVSANMKDENTTTISNYQKFEEIYIIEKPLEKTSQNLEEYKNVSQSVKKERICDNDEQMDKYETENTNSTPLTNYPKVEEIYIKEEPLEKTSQDFELHENVLKSIKKEECITDDDNQIDKACGNSITINNDIRKTKKTNSNNSWCELCNKSFTTKSSLKRHLKIHSGEREFRCYICNKNFTQKGTLSVHLKTHERNKEYQCGICNKLFSVKTNLKCHMRTHSGMESQELQCPTCFKYFTTNSHLTEHMKIHSGIKDFKCSICNKQFTQHSTLYNHMKLHTRIKEYKCTICNKQFTQRSILYRHKKIHNRITTH